MYIYEYTYKLNPLLRGEVAIGWEMSRDSDNNDKVKGQI